MPKLDMWEIRKLDQYLYGLGRDLKRVIRP